ncbi:hypothetical protein FHL15_003383 [Xylaria flabelliformis]|uniref:Dihydroorotate dehydrogenase (fumarate) n=1 Tax=Xylaria flabelliformis TaxID=2512241 RepID=A0A553I6K2_9PEZI|nr:hypothetical protein FHL15_003383 [Xylaria flabelliformis]
MRVDDHLPPSLRIDPPLLNSANPWATTLEQLRDLYNCPATGAVTTRTALLEGFPHDEGVHQYAIFEAGTHHRVSGKSDMNMEKDRGDTSLNTLGYSPIPLDGYLGFIRQIDEEVKAEGPKEGEHEGQERLGGRKPFIVSVTGTPDEVAECYRRIARCAGDVGMPLAMEINLSCPNIPGKPPPAYEGGALRGCVRRVAEESYKIRHGDGDGDGNREEGKGGGVEVPWGVKTPPYTHAGQFDMFVSSLRDCAVSAPGRPSVCPLTFVTATNTLGSCLLLSDSESQSGSEKTFEPVLPGLGIGGLAGAPLHPLALGNVATLRRLLDEDATTRHVLLLGIGGVADKEGYGRMRSVGAAAVGVGTALGVRGLGVFGEIWDGLGEG